MVSPSSWPVLAPYAPSVLRRRLPCALGVSMDQQFITKLETPLASSGLEASAVRQLILAGLTWPTEYWAGLAVGWLEQGAPLDADVALALDAVASKPFSQGVRHRAFSLALRWQRTQLTPNPSFERTPVGAAQVKR